MDDDVVTCEKTSPLINVLLLQDRWFIFSLEIICRKDICLKEIVQVLKIFNLLLLVSFSVIHRLYYTILHTVQYKYIISWRVL